VDRVPLEKLIGPAVVIDVTAKTRADGDYRLTRDDVVAFERAHGKIPAGAIVLLRTGWSSRWPDRKSYLGDDTPNDASKLHFPSFGVEAARLLIQERRAAAIGVDVASIDYGPSQDFMVHRIAAAADVPGIENLTNLNLLPATGALVFALPMRSGSRCRARSAAIDAVNSSPRGIARGTRSPVGSRRAEPWSQRLGTGRNEVDEQTHG
jgi:kynurenine formamidase